MEIFPLTRFNKDSDSLYPHTSFYTEEYARNVCSLYLAKEIESDTYGHVRANYRLHAHKQHTFADCMKYDVHCPRCDARMYPVGEPLNAHTLALYTCKFCNKEN